MFEGAAAMGNGDEGLSREGCSPQPQSNNKRRARASAAARAPELGVDPDE